MTNSSHPASAAAVSVPSAGPAEQPQPQAVPFAWTLDPTHTSVSFRVRHMMVSNVRGEFQAVEGKASWAPDRPERSMIEAAITVASISTRDPQRDAHLRSPDFFDADAHPQITFKSRGVGRHKNGRLEVIGDLTIRGTSRVIALDVEGPTGAHVDPWGNVRVGASVRTTIKRSDFGMTWNSVLETGGVLVGDDVTIEIDAELIRQKEG